MLMLSRRHQRLALALLALTVTACNRSSREAQEVPGPGAVGVVKEAAVAEADVGPGVVCDEEHRDAVREELQDMCAWSVWTPEVDVPMSPWGGGPYGGSADVLIAVTPDHVRVLPVDDVHYTIGEGRFMEEHAPIVVADLARTLAAIPPRRKNSDGDPQPLHWNLQIASDVPTAVVAEVLQTLLDAKMPDGVLELQTSEGPAAVRDPILHAKLNASRQEQAPKLRITWAKQELERLGGSCLNFEDTFEATSSVDPGQVCWALAAGLFVAINDCGCEREAEILTVMYTAVFGAASPKKQSTPVRARILPAAKARRGKTWGSIVAGLEKKEDALSLWVAGEE